MITEEEFEEIMEAEDYDSSSDVDGNLEGLIIQSKYFDNVVCGADHDIVYGCDIDGLIEKGITKEDVILLRKYGWHTQDGYLACFV
jgi:hypothetical protein